jgi:copper(I)-binding protein
MKRAFRAIAFAGLTVIAAHAFAHEYTAGDIRVEHPWARATIGQAKTGAAYMTFVNTGGAPDRLLGATSPAAERAEAHAHTMEGNVMKMHPVQAIEVAPGSPTVLKPGGLHIMLFGLKAPLKAGETFPVTLSFERAGPLTVDVLVEQPAAPPPSYEHRGHHKGS